MPKERIIAAQATFHGVQTARNLPNILRSGSTRTYKKPASDKTDFYSVAEEMNTSFDLNTTLSSVDSEKEDRYGKIVSPKSHRKRKQVHNPLDVRYDVPKWFNNKNNEHVTQTTDQTKTDRKLQASLVEHKESCVVKEKLKLSKKHKNDGHRCTFSKKSKGSSRKSSGKAKGSNRKSNLDSGLDIIQDTSIADIVLQNINSFPNGDTFARSLSPTDDPNYTNDLNDSGRVYQEYVKSTSQSDEMSKILHNNYNKRDNNYNKEIYNLDKKYDINHNVVTLEKSEELGAVQHKIAQKDCKFSTIKSEFEEVPPSANVTSNFLFASNVLCTCTCTNCTCDKDIILYEDTVPSCTSSDKEMEFLAPYEYDFYTSDYYHIFGDSWLRDFDEKGSHFEEFEQSSITSKDTSIDNVTKLIENNTNISTSIERSESQNFQPCDRMQDIGTELYSKRLDVDSDEPAKSSTSMEHIKILDETGYLNLENVSMKESKVTSQNNAICQTVAPANLSGSKSKRHAKKSENAKDIYVIQCGQCGRLFNESQQFRKHFTHCSFSKEDFKCHLCNKIYRYKSSLIQHLKLVHHETHTVYKKLYTCTKCKKLYVRFRSFQRHLLLHDNW